MKHEQRLYMFIYMLVRCNNKTSSLLPPIIKSKGTELCQQRCMTQSKNTKLLCKFVQFNYLKMNLTKLQNRNIIQFLHMLRFKLYFIII